MPRGNKGKQKKRLAVGLLAFIAVLLGVTLALLPERYPVPGGLPVPEGLPVPGAGGPSRPGAAATGEDPGEPAGAAAGGGTKPAIAPGEDLRAGAASAAAAATGREPSIRLAVVIDDAGHNLRDLEPFLGFPAPLTIAVLPFLSHSREAARAAHRAGKEVLLHLPMEPLNGEDCGPGSITTGLSGEEIHRLLDEQFSELPEAMGTNNHMGSLATADERVMGHVMSWLRGRDKIFLDSRTTAATVAGAAAERHGVAFLSRDVFIDNIRDPQEIRREILRGVEIGRQKGAAILIGHATSPGTLEALREMLPRLEREGVRLVRLEDLL